MDIGCVGLRKMVHNGIEYRMMQGCAEGFEFMPDSDNNFAVQFIQFRSR